MGTQSSIPTPTLADAITAAETAQSSYQGAQVQTANDQSAAQAIQAKLDAATAQVANDQQAQVAAAAQFNAALTGLIAAATAAMIPTQTP